MTERYKRILKNTGIIMAGNAGTGIVEFMLLPLYTRWLSVSEYGLADILKVYSTILLSLVSCCIADSLFVFPKGQGEELQKEYFTSAFFFLLTATALSCVLTYVLNAFGEQYDVHNSLFDNIWFVLGIVLSKMLLRFAQQYARGIDKIAIYSFTGTIVAISLVILSFFLIPSYGVEGYIVCMMASNVIGFIFAFFFSKSYRFLKWKSYRNSSLQEMLRYSMPLLPNGIMWWIVGALNRPIMESNIGLHDIGLYAVANKFPEIASMMFAVFAVSWQTSVMEEYKENGFENFYNQVGRTYFLLLIFILIFVTIISKPIITLFTVPDYYSAWMYVPLLTLGAVFSAFASAVGVVFSAAKESKYFFYSSIWGAIVALLLNVVLIPLMGINGAVLSVVLSFFTLAVSRIFFAWKFVRLINLNKYVVTAFCAILSVLTVFVHDWGWLLSINLIVAMLVILVNIDIIKKVVLVVK